VRLLTDLAVFTSALSVKTSEDLGFRPGTQREPLDYDFFCEYLERQPGLTVDKLKSALEFVWRAVERAGKRGIIFAYDEAQVVRDREDKEEYPLAVLLETFQSLQRRGARFLLLLTGLPTLFPKLVESRTYAERMFGVQELGRLSPQSSQQAITRPLLKTGWKFTEEAIQQIIEASDGYPYFLQYICRETLDHVIANPADLTVPMRAITRKLDSDFFAGRWESVTDRQRELLYCIAQLEHADEEFTIGEIVEMSKERKPNRPFTAGDVSQMLPRLMDRGLIYRNRIGKYCFAVPLFSGFIRRRLQSPPFQQKLLFGQRL
jgi:hypothetical protein